MVATLTNEQQRLLEALRKSGIKPPSSVLAAREVSKLSCIDHMERYFYIPETGRPVELQPFQKIIMNIIAGDHNYPNLLPFYPTVEYSAIKKVGKSAVSGGYARWRAESNTTRDQILFFANDETQSRGRGYAAVASSIELDPLFDKQKRVLLDKDGNVRWRIIEDYLEHVPTGTIMRAVNVDYRGEAGSNPSLTVFTEAWGFDTQKQELLFDEMTQVLTREKSQRFVEGYAGYTGKSKLLEKLENLVVRDGRQLTRDDIPDWPFPNEDLLPLWVNDEAGVFAYLDRGPIARTRMPWTVGPEADEYYKQQAITLTPEQFDRLHNNYWVSPTEAFIPIEWWHQCQDSSIPELLPAREPIRITRIPDVDDQTVQTILNPNFDHPEFSQLTPIMQYIHPSNWKPTNNPQTPIVITGDASVSGDCTALTGVSRHPTRYSDVALRLAYKWDPPRGGKIDYERTTNQLNGLSFWQTVLDTCLRYNVVQFGYDEWQLHHLVNQLKNLGLVWCRPFSQATARDIADKQLYDLIKLRRIGYNPTSSKIDHAAVEQHLKNASRQQRPKEDTKLHIIKSSEEAKIDLTVSLSMSSAECLRLDL